MKHQRINLTFYLVKSTVKPIGSPFAFSAGRITKPVNSKNFPSAHKEYALALASALVAAKCRYYPD